MSALDNLKLIWCHAEPSMVPYYPNQYLVRYFFWTSGTPELLLYVQHSMINWKTTATFPFIFTLITKFYKPFFLLWDQLDVTSYTYYIKEITVKNIWNCSSEWRHIKSLALCVTLLATIQTYIFSTCLWLWRHFMSACRFLSADYTRLSCIFK